MYHILFFSVPLDKREEVPKLINTVKKVIKNLIGVELVEFFFPRGSGYMYATITKSPRLRNIRENSGKTHSNSYTPKSQRHSNKTNGHVPRQNHLSLPKTTPMTVSTLLKPKNKIL